MANEKDVTPLSSLASLNRKDYEEELTPHNLTLLILIRSYILKPDFDKQNVSIKSRRGACRLIQYFFQCPDLELHDFVHEMKKSKYALDDEVFTRFLKNLARIVRKEMDAMVSFVMSCKHYVANSLSPNIHRHLPYSIHSCSPVGVFVRKMVVHMEQITMAQMCKLYRLYQRYYVWGRRKSDCSECSYTLHRGSASQLMVDVLEKSDAEHDDDDELDEERYDIECQEMNTMAEKRLMEAGDDEIESVEVEEIEMDVELEGAAASAPPNATTVTLKKNKKDCKKKKGYEQFFSKLELKTIDEYRSEWRAIGELGRQDRFSSIVDSIFDVQHKRDVVDVVDECRSWSERQTEMLLVKQATYIEFDEVSALSPPHLQTLLKKIAAINPRTSETYFVSYLNCLRVKEYSGAIRNLLQFFDHMNFDDRTKNNRYAALNMAILKDRFNDKPAALVALKECILLAYESSDTFLLHIAQAWLFYLKFRKQLNQMASAVKKCEDMELYQTASLNLQLFAKEYISSMPVHPRVVLDLLDRSDVMNVQQTVPDVLLTSVAHRIAYYNALSQHTLAFLLSQLLLNVHTTYAIFGLATYNTEAVCLAICNVAYYYIKQGKYGISRAVLNHAAERFPTMFKNWWQLCELVMLFEQALHSCKFHEAAAMANHIATFDYFESLIRKAQLALELGDGKRVCFLVETLEGEFGVTTEANVDDRLEEWIAPLENPPSRYMIRGWMLKARAVPAAQAFEVLQKTLDHALRFGYQRLVATVQLRIAHVQVEMGLVEEAERMCEQCSESLMAEEGACERAALMVTWARCHLASLLPITIPHSDNAATPPPPYHRCMRKLRQAARYYEQVGSNIKLKDVYYYQAMLANDYHMKADRNRIALKFRLLDESTPTSSCFTYLYCSCS